MDKKMKSVIFAITVTTLMILGLLTVEMILLGTPLIIVENMFKWIFSVETT